MKERTKRASVLSAMGWFAISYGLAMVGYLATNAVASRWLGVAEFGSFVAGTTAAIGLGQFALIGAHRAGLRDAATLGPDPDRAMGDLRGGAAGVAWITLPLAAGVAGVIGFFWADGPQVSQVLVGLGAAALVYFSGLQKLWGNYLRGLGHVRLSSLLEGRSGGALVGLSQVCTLAAFWILLPTPALALAFVATAIAFSIPVLVAGHVVRRHWRHLPRRGSVLQQLRRSIARSWRFAVNQFATFLGGAAELWIAGLILTAVESSLFSASFRLTFLLAIPMTSMQVVFAPLCARLISEERHSELEQILRTGATVALLGTSMIIVPMVVAPGEILSLVFGPEFAAGSVVFLILLTGNVANQISGLSGTVLTMSHREGVAATTQTVVVVTRVVSGVLAAIYFGLEGLAISAAANSVLLYSLMWWHSARFGVKTHPTLRPRLRAMMSARV